MSFHEQGFEIKTGCIAPDTVNAIISDITSLNESYPRHGIRNAEKKLETVNSLAHSARLMRMAESYLNGAAEIVRVIVFDKTPERNWLVSWHQDKTICFDRKADIAGWGPWTIKDGTHHVQPSIDVLEQMITLRIHLDDADESNGCLKVIPGSHKRGILSKAAQDQIVAESNTVTCTARAGDMLVMRPHLLHASSKGTSPSHRRIVHIEYSSFPLPAGLNWA